MALNLDCQPADYERLIERIKTEPDRLCLDDTSVNQEDELVARIGRQLLNRAGLGRPEYICCQWFVRELAKVLRRNIGIELALALETLVIKWRLRGMNERLLQALICHCYSELSGRTGAIP